MIPKLGMILNNSLWSTVSKAFEKSRNTTIVFLLLSRASYISLVTLYKASVVPIPGQKPY